MDPVNNPTPSWEGNVLNIRQAKWLLLLLVFLVPLWYAPWFHYPKKQPVPVGGSAKTIATEQVIVTRVANLLENNTATARKNALAVLPSAGATATLRVDIASNRGTTVVEQDFAKWLATVY